MEAVGTMGLGGYWAPEDCQARHSVCIIVPYRDRKDHLWTLLYRIIPVLKRQQLEFKIFVVEQVYQWCISVVILNRGDMSPCSGAIISMVGSAAQVWTGSPGYRKNS